MTATLLAGTYYVGISSSGNEPINSAGQPIFQSLSQSGDTTAVRGPATRTNPNALGNFNSNEFDTITAGNYQIDFSIPVTVPEPRTWSALALGAIASALAVLRRRRA